MDPRLLLILLSLQAGASFAEFFFGSCMPAAIAQQQHNASIINPLFRAPNEFILHP